jgi:starch phosphorylase
MVCADFQGYLEREAEAATVYRDAREWSRRALFNIAGSSRFSSDATIRLYASEIWGLRPVKTDFRLLSDKR